MAILEPEKRTDCWKCPDCGWLNPYPDEVILTYPPITEYRCKKCDYHYDDQHELPESEEFAMRYPNGRVDKAR